MQVSVEVSKAAAVGNGVFYRCRNLLQLAAIEKMIPLLIQMARSLPNNNITTDTIKPLYPLSYNVNKKPQVSVDVGRKLLPMTMCAEKLISNNGFPSIISYSSMGRGDHATAAAYCNVALLRYHMKRLYPYVAGLGRRMMQYLVATYTASNRCNLFSTHNDSQ